MAITRLIQVTNISPAISEEQMLTLFGFVGKIEAMCMYPSMQDLEVASNTPKICYIKFFDATCVGVSQYLTNTVFNDRALVVTPVEDGQIPNEEKAKEMAAKVGLPPVGNKARDKPKSEIVNLLEGTPPHQVIVSHDPRLEEMGLPKYPPIPASYEGHIIEEIRRTVLIIDINVDVTSEELIQCFEKAGDIKYVKFCSRSDNIRYALIEFVEQSHVIQALKMNGLKLKGTVMKVYHSTQAITKPETKSNEVAQQEVVEALTRVKEAESLILAAIDPFLSFGKSKKGRSRSKSPRRSRNRRSRSRSRRHSRSRSPHRRRASPRIGRSRSRSRHRRLRSKSPRRHRKSRSKSPSRTQRKSRSKSLSRTLRKSRSKSPSRTQRKSRSKSPSRTQRKSRSKSPSRTHRKSRSKSPSRTHPKSRSKSPSRTHPKSSSKSPSRIHRKSRSKSPSRTQRKSRSKSPSRTQRKSRSKSPSRTQRKSRSKSPSRTQRKSRSKSPPRTQRKSRSKSPSQAQRKSRSRSPRVRKKSRSKSPRTKRKIESKSPSRSKRKSRSKSPIRSKKRSRSKSPPKVRRKSRSPHSKRRSRSRSPRSKYRSTSVSRMVPFKSGFGRDKLKTLDKFSAKRNKNENVKTSRGKERERERDGDRDRKDLKHDRKGVDSRSRRSEKEKVDKKSKQKDCRNQESGIQNGLHSSQIEGNYADLSDADKNSVKENNSLETSENEVRIKNNFDSEVTGTDSYVDLESFEVVDSYGVCASEKSVSVLNNVVETDGFGCLGDGDVFNTVVHCDSLSVDTRPKENVSSSYIKNSSLIEVFEGSGSKSISPSNFASSHCLPNLGGCDTHSLSPVETL